MLPVHARLVALIGIVLVAAGCEGESGTSTERDPDGVLELPDLNGDGWEVSGEGGDTLCGELSSVIRSISGVAEGFEETFSRDTVTVVSQAWIESSGVGSRRADFDRIRSHAGSCGAVDDAGEHGISEFAIVEDGQERFVVRERRTINGLAGGADQVYFREGDVVGRVVVTYEGDPPQIEVTDLEDAARSRAAELEENGHS